MKRFIGRRGAGLTQEEMLVTHAITGEGSGEMGATKLVVYYKISLTFHRLVAP